MLFGHDEGKNLKQLCDGEKDVVCIQMGGTGISAETTEEILLELGGVSKKLIWQNASPGSSFPEHNILIQNAVYDAYEISYCYSTGFQQEADSITLDRKNGPLDGIMNVTWAKNMCRSAEIQSVDETTGNVTIDFGAGEHYSDYGKKYTGTNDTDIYCIPLKIYGIKGVK